LDTQALQSKTVTGGVYSINLKGTVDGGLLDYPFDMTSSVLIPAIQFFNYRQPNWELDNDLTASYAFRDFSAGDTTLTVRSSSIPTAPPAGVTDLTGNATSTGTLDNWAKTRNDDYTLSLGGSITHLATAPSEAGPADQIWSTDGTLSLNDFRYTSIPGDLTYSWIQPRNVNSLAVGWDLDRATSINSFEITSTDNETPAPTTQVGALQGDFAVGTKTEGHVWRSNFQANDTLTCSLPSDILEDLNHSCIDSTYSYNTDISLKVPRRTDFYYEILHQPINEVTASLLFDSDTYETDITLSAEEAAFGFSNQKSFVDPTISFYVGPRVDGYVYYTTFYGTATAGCPSDLLGCDDGTFTYIGTTITTGIPKLIDFELMNKTDNTISVQWAFVNAKHFADLTASLYETALDGTPHVETQTSDEVLGGLAFNTVKTPGASYDITLSGLVEADPVEEAASHTHAFGPITMHFSVPYMPRVGYVQNPDNTFSFDYEIAQATNVNKFRETTLTNAVAGPTQTNPYVEDFTYTFDLGIKDPGTQYITSYTAQTLNAGSALPSDLCSPPPPDYPAIDQICQDVTYSFYGSDRLLTPAIHNFDFIQFANNDLTVSYNLDNYSAGTATLTAFVFDGDSTSVQDFETEGSLSYLTLPNWLKLPGYDYTASVSGTVTNICSSLDPPCTDGTYSLFALQHISIPDPMKFGIFQPVHTDMTSTYNILDTASGTLTMLATDANYDLGPNGIRQTYTNQPKATLGPWTVRMGNTYDATLSGTTTKVSTLWPSSVDGTYSQYASTSSSIPNQCYYPNGTAYDPPIPAGLDLPQDGSSENPFLIESASDLDCLRQLSNDDAVFNLVGGGVQPFRTGNVYQITQDLDLALYAPSTNLPSGWTPIGTKDLPFGSIIQGPALINGLTISRPQTAGQGLFGYVEDATISNLGLIDYNVEAGQTSAALVGSAASSTIAQIYANGVVTSAADQVAGIVGTVQDTLSVVTQLLNLGDVVDPLGQAVANLPPITFDVSDLWRWQGSSSQANLYAPFVSDASDLPSGQAAGCAQFADPDFWTSNLGFSSTDWDLNSVSAGYLPTPKASALTASKVPFSCMILVAADPSLNAGTITTNESSVVKLATNVDNSVVYRYLANLESLSFTAAPAQNYGLSDWTFSQSWTDSSGQTLVVPPATATFALPNLAEQLGLIGDQVLVGHFEPWRTLSFESNGGTSIPTQTILNQRTATKPADPVRDNFIFLGWYANPNFEGEPFDFAAPILDDLKLYAKWEVIPEPLNPSDIVVEYSATGHETYLSWIFPKADGFSGKYSLSNLLTGFFDEGVIASASNRIDLGEKFAGTYIMEFVGTIIYPSGLVPYSKTMTIVIPLVQLQAPTSISFPDVNLSTKTIKYDGSQKSTKVPAVNAARKASIQWLAAFGVTVGSGKAGGKTTYRPQDSVNRGSMAQFLQKLAGFTDSQIAAHYADNVNPFKDLASLKAANLARYYSILWLADTGITVGVGCTVSTTGKIGGANCKYEPTNPVNRGAMAEFMQKFAGLSPTPASTSDFPDVNTAAKTIKYTGVAKSENIKALNRNRVGAINWMAKTGITVGSGSASGKTTYRPQDPVTRGAMAQFMHKLAYAVGSTSVAPS
jgi:uncharacterized repeat protein (TIGR02543 family)